MHRPKALDVSCNSVGPDGATALGRALAQHPTLLSLDISANPIGNLGCVALAEALENNRSLKHLDLHGKHADVSICDAVMFGEVHELGKMVEDESWCLA